MFILLTALLLFQIKSENIIQKLNTKINAVIFDLDTLLDTRCYFDDINQILINTYGNGKPYSPEYRMITHGTSLIFENRFMFEQFKINITLEKFSEIKNDYIKERIKSLNPLKNWINELTNNIKNKFGLKTAIITGLHKDLVEFELAPHKKWVDSDFDLLITGDDKRIKHGKPSPDIFILAANSLGVNLEECLIIDNSLNGIKAAISSGARAVIGLPDNQSTKYVFENFQFDRYKTDFIILNSLKDFDYSLLDG